MVISARQMSVVDINCKRNIWFALNSVFVITLVVLSLTVYDCFFLFHAMPYIGFFTGFVILSIYMYLGYWCLTACLFLTVGIIWVCNKIGSCIRRRFRR